MRTRKKMSGLLAGATFGIALGWVFVWAMRYPFPLTLAQWTVDGIDTSYDDTGIPLFYGIESVAFKDGRLGFFYSENSEDLGFAQENMSLLWLSAGFGLIAMFLVRKVRKSSDGISDHCGYDLRATPNLCPECGNPRRDFVKLDSLS